MGKYDKKPQKKSSSLSIWIICVCILAAAVVVVAALLLFRAFAPDATPTTTPVQTTEPVQTTVPTDTVPVSNPTMLPDGLVITDMGKYAGIFMEDGTDEVVSNVMMLILRNDGTEDLQLARINLHYSDFTAQFEVTNLPAGQSVVLLEKNRHPYVEGSYKLEATTIAHFSAPMSMLPEQFEVTGGDGYLDIKNISDQDITGDVFIYYKNSASDGLLYGGITYRVRLSGGLAAGESTRLIAGHYHEGSSSLLMVNYSE